MDRRSGDPVHCSKTNKKRHIQRIRSPSRYTHLYRPRFEGKYFRSRFRFFRTMEERFLQRPNFAMRYQRHHRGPWSSLQLSRRPRASPPPRQRLNKGLDKSSFTALRQHTKPGTTDIPWPSSGDRPSLPFTVSQKASKSNAARNRAIQKKQEQIEEVYRQDCDTFGMVVKMLVTKDPSLEKLIQLSLHENLRDIGMRCVKAMEQFIHEYDSQEIHTPSIK
ncbi:periphilin-1 [Pimephales promelas]|uniref:periphilin-1 n=1 Tax=Pimephales promelas TaxID=90988 RepID=UPI0019554EEE|nr:periphilin-1 [Pimephales promelas]KAG1949121.1 periphilin-1 [Pimephales promelas]